MSANKATHAVNPRNEVIACVRIREDGVGVECKSVSKNGRKCGVSINGSRACQDQTCQAQKRWGAVLIDIISGLVRTMTL